MLKKLTLGIILISMLSILSNAIDVPPVEKRE